MLALWTLIIATSQTPESVTAEMEALYARYPAFIERSEIGTTHLGTPLIALRIGSHPEDRSRPAVLLSGCQHANETSTPLHVLDAARTLLERRHEAPYSDWFRQMTLVVVPLVNPDGYVQRTRKNTRPIDDTQRRVGVDLNRNYPFGWHKAPTRFTSADPNSRFFRGPSPGSEPEVQAIMDLARRERFVAAINYHSAATKLIVPYSAPGVIEQPQLPWEVAEAMLDALPHRFRGRRYRATRGLYPVSGGEKDWLFHEFGTLAYVLELPYRRPEGARLDESITHSRGAWETLFSRFVSGPSVSVRVQTPSRRPVDATVELLYPTGERVSRQRTNPQNGWYHTYMPSTDALLVRVEAGGAIRDIPLSVTGENQTLTVLVPDTLPALTLR
ncbi:MAG: M14 family zinc carboxypeptidase [Myxococcota bacterium]